MKENKRLKEEAATWIVRLIVGGTFMVSGFVKAIDPWGLLYKSDEYLAALSLDIWPNLQLVGVFCLSALEFLIGIFLIFGCFRKSVSVVSALVMCFMLPLTLWLAMDNPVADCGCFGDAFIISNWASFWKNVVLALGVVWLWNHNKSCSWLVTPALQWLVFVVSGLFIFIIELFGYISQPLLDFRPYNTGMPLVDAVNQEEADSRFMFIYEKDGIRKEINEDEELPDESEGWVFVDRIEVQSSVNQVSNEESPRNLRVWGVNSDEDMTDEAIDDSGNELIVMMPNLKEVSPATTWKLNSLYEWSEKHGVKMIGVVAGSPTEIDDWEDISMASYPIYSADDTQIKEVVRGNPGVVYLVDGIIEWKSTLTAINIDDFMSPEIADDARSFGLDNLSILRNCIYAYIIVMMALVLLSFIPKIKDCYLKSFPAKAHVHQEEPIHDDMAHP
ncbi:MAG: DoxX family protein [Muribaculaceae bacterium]|nr:DoxX family protein [Muribaculaceae bacterium]